MGNPPPLPLVQPELKHSGLGIASFVIALAAGVAIFTIFIVAGLIELSTPGGMDEKSPTTMIVGFLVMGTLLVDLLGLGLGIAGLLQPDRKKIFAILGVVISAVLALGTLGLMVVGMMADK